MRKVITIITMIAGMILFAVPASAARPDVYADITAVSLTDTGAELTVTIYNRKTESIEGFALYDARQNSAVSIGGKSFILGKYLDITIKPRTAKRVRFRIKAAGLSAEDITGIRYRLNFSCWCGSVYIYGRSWNY